MARFFSKGNSYLNTKEEEGPVPLDHLGSETGLLTGHTHVPSGLLGGQFFSKEKEEKLFAAASVRHPCPAAAAAAVCYGGQFLVHRSANNGRLHPQSGVVLELCHLPPYDSRLFLLPIFLQVFMSLLSTPALFSPHLLGRPRNRIYLAAQPPAAILLLYVLYTVCVCVWVEKPAKIFPSLDLPLPLFFVVWPVCCR